MDQVDILFKVIVIGDMSVGKSQLWSRWLKDEFDFESRTTVGVEFGCKSFKLKEGVIVGFQLWDTGGQERYRSITKQYYRGAHGVVLVFDLTARETFKSLTSWLNDVRSASISENAKLVLCGNKSDLHKLREVSHEEAERFAIQNGMEYVEASALTGENCSETLQRLLQDIHVKGGPELIERIKDAKFRDFTKRRRRRIALLARNGNENNSTPGEDSCSC